jgi:hypothetical protein
MRVRVHNSQVRVHNSQSKHQGVLSMLKYKWNKIVCIFIGNFIGKGKMRVHNSQSKHQGVFSMLKH